MSLLVLKAICDADECERLGDISYSTNPRQYVTLEQMVIFHSEKTEVKAYESTKE